MSYEPEILISNERAVLEKIRNPLTKVVAWTPQGKTLYTPLKLISEFRAAVANNPDTEFGGEYSESFLKSLKRWADINFTRQLDRIVEPLVSSVHGKHLDGDNAFDLRYFPVGTVLGDSGYPHIDRGLISAFISANDHMDSTYFIPSRFAQGSIERYGSVPDADCSKAVQIPGLSICIAKIGEIAHLGPNFDKEHEVAGHARILLSRTYKAKMTIQGDYFPAQPVLIAE